MLQEGNWDDTYTPKRPGAGLPAASAPAQPSTSPTSAGFWNDTPAPNTPRPGPANPTSKTATAAAAPNPGENIVRTMGVAPSLNWSLGDAPAAPAPPPGVIDYTPHVAAVTNAPDPNTAAIAHDTLARTVFSNLSSAGHQVEWGDDGNLMVDGRPYTVAGMQNIGAPTPEGPSTAPHGAVPPTQGPTEAATGGQAFDFGDPVYNAIGALFQKYGHPPTLSDVSQWGRDIDANYMRAIEAKIAHEFGPGGPQSGPNGTSPNHGTTPAGYSYEGFLAELHALPANGDSVRQVVAAHPEWGITVLNAKGDKVRLPDGRVKDIGYSFGDPSHAAWQDLDVTEGGGGGGGGAPAVNAHSPGLDALWAQVHGLQNGQAYQPVANPQLDKFIQDLLSHPESMDPHMVEVQKAADAEEQQQAADSADQNLKRFGYSSGISDSNWLASERAATARSADQGIITGRRQIEQKAAETNMADRRAAAGIGINKLQLDGALKAEAARLNISRDQLIAQILSHIASLEQNDRQFGADLGYRYDSLNSSNDNAYWNDVTH